MKIDNVMFAKFMGDDEEYPYLYHEIWDCLWRVFDKIQSCLDSNLRESIQISNGRCCITGNDKRKMIDVNLCSYDTKAAVYKAFYEFIEWYNSQPKQ